MKASEEIIKKYQSYISNIEWNIKTNNPPEDVVLREKRRVECYSEIVKDLQQLASHPSPMSAEQVEVLHAIMVLAEHGIPGYAFGDNEAACEMDNRLSEICRLASTTPSVKADGWVSVDKEKEFHKVLKCLKNNKVMVGTREDGIYIRLAGRESEGEAFTLHFALAYPFPKLPPHQNNNK